MEPAPQPSPPAPTFGDAIGAFGAWLKRQPLAAFLLLGVFGTLVYFFFCYRVFTNGSLSTARWAMDAWNPENNQEHSFLILPISIFLVWYHRGKIAVASKRPSLYGLLFVVLGVAIFVIAVRTLQPRAAIVAVPILIFGSAWFLWGREVARVFAFPCAFMLFMVPVGGFVQGTVSLQLLVSSVVNWMSGLIGVKIEASGTTIRSMDGSFNFEIAEGCSGIRSLMAMTTLTALYAHFTQRVLWKKLTLFGSSILFAVIGNIGRIFTVILVAKFYDPEFASGLYHDYSGFVFFPIAVVAMVGFGNLLTADWRSLYRRYYLSEDQTIQKAEADRGGKISYDY